MVWRGVLTGGCGPRASSISMRSASTTERWRTVVRPIAPKRNSRCRILPSREATAKWTRPTGVPGGATPGKPVGLVHFAVASRDGKILHREFRFGAIGRTTVRQRSVVEALRMLMELARGPQPPAKPRRETMSRLRPRVARTPRRTAVKRRRPPRT